MARVLPPPDTFDMATETVIIGAGAAGLVAALSAAGNGHEVLVLERDAQPSGSTALSAGLIPAAGTRLQHAAGIDDTPDLFARDIQSKAKGENDPVFVDMLARHAAGVINWLEKDHGLPFSVIDDFDYPGHSRRRMHGLPTRSGQELIDALRSKCEGCGVDIICKAQATTLFRDEDRIVGLSISRPDGGVETIRCGSIILACNGYGGNRTLVDQYMPEITEALWFGHDGNTGDALLWGQALGAQTRHLGSYQGHGNVAHPHGILITWAVIAEGGFQVNIKGERFWNEAQGYSEAARAVLSQPEGIAFTIFDERIAGVARQFADFQNAERQGAVIRAGSLPELARRLDLPETSLSAVTSQIAAKLPDAFGRVFPSLALSAPFCAVRVTGALFHTQGGLVVNRSAQVLSADGPPYENLYAVGGAACGGSGAGDTWYLSGNGLLSAVVLGRVAVSAVSE